jgi:hypothetical protein
MYRNHQAGLPTSALLHSFELRHGLIGRLHKYVKQKVMKYTHFQNEFDILRTALHLDAQLMMIQVYCY